MVFNNEARNLLLHTDLATGIVSHDWWAYLVVTACGGEVYYDKNPAIRYRQHGRNLVGSDNNWLARVVRLRWLAKGRFKTWSDLNIAGLEHLRPYMTSANQSILSNFCRLRRQNLVQRLIGLKRSAIYRQTFFGNIGLLIAILLKRV